MDICYPSYTILNFKNNNNFYSLLLINPYFVGYKTIHFFSLFHTADMTINYIVRANKSIRVKFTIH